MVAPGRPRPVTNLTVMILLRTYSFRAFQILHLFPATFQLLPGYMATCVLRHFGSPFTEVARSGASGLSKNELSACCH